MTRVVFFSNHTDVSFLEDYFGEPVYVIRHPYVEPTWDTDELCERCNVQIAAAVAAEDLVINGEPTLMSIIVLARSERGKRTGFICMKKDDSGSRAEKQSDGSIRHTNTLTPVGVRWVI